MRPSPLPTVPPIIRTLPLQDLHAAFQKAAFSPFSFLLEGSSHGWFDGRFSLFGGCPFALFKSRGAYSEFHYLDGPRSAIWCDEKDPMEALQHWLDRFRPSDSNSAETPTRLEMPFLHGGVVGYFGYDLVSQFEKLPRPRFNDPRIPDIYLLFLDFFVVADHRLEQLHLLYHPTLKIRMGKTPQNAIREGHQKIETLQRCLEATKEEEEAQASHAVPQPNLTREAYIQNILRAKDYIAAGDIFQINLSQRFSIPNHPASPFPVYKRLQQINPSPFAAYLSMGEIQIASGSPERLVRLQTHPDGDRIETWPIAGTAPRGRNLEEDTRLAEALHASRKERAEHLMLVDLSRNDLGRVCQYGSVRVDALMEIERYSHVMHLVSRVSGLLRQGILPLHALRALFPGGTITGAPKIRCMEIIAEIEGRSRGIYTGAMGYLSFAGEMDLNIAIRTWVRCGQEMTFQVGGGIVADSDPDTEYQETLHKARALIQALTDG
jgi:anthranilate/para-aminobenzoate synthase component I